jgi:prepilin-type N-terminal cleavage/methylation domain-containing protein
MRTIALELRIPGTRRENRQKLRIAAVFFNLSANHEWGAMDFNTSQRQRGFSLVELLVCIGIIAVLLAVLLPALGKARERAVRVKCMANLRQILQATISYVSDNAGSLPQPNDILLENSPPRVGWLYNPPIANPANPLQVQTGALWPYLGHREVYMCPLATTTYISGPSQQMTSYLMSMVVLGFGTRNYSFPLRRMNPRGILFWEAGEDEAGYVTPSSWDDGAAYPFGGLTTRHANGAQIGSFDTSVEWMSSADYQSELAKFPGRFWCNPDRAKGN